MKGRDFVRLAAKYLTPKFPSLRLGRGIVYVDPTTYSVRGFAVDSSGFDSKTFALDCFIQPLFVPADGLRFTFAFRLRDPRNNQDWWDLAERQESDAFQGISMAIEEQFLPTVEKYREPWSLEKWPGAWDGIHMAEGAAYGLVLGEEATKANKWLERAGQLGTQDGRDWAAEVASRAAQVREVLNRDQSEAVKLLRTWANHTRTSIASELAQPGEVTRPSR